jgi:hypothetical protein
MATKITIGLSQNLPQKNMATKITIGLTQNLPKNMVTKITIGLTQNLPKKHGLKDYYRFNTKPTPKKHGH